MRFPTAWLDFMQVLYAAPTTTPDLEQAQWAAGGEEDGKGRQRDD